jgi:diacylglycerol kinase family enzyme
VPRAALIVNPFATAVTDEKVAAVARSLARTFDVELLPTQRRGHATELVREAGEVDAIFVFSGDGGFNEAVNGSNGLVPLGFVPGGGTSVLPRALGLPRDPVAAAELLAQAFAARRTRRISLGRVNGRRFTFAAGLGLDAEAVRRIDALGRREDGRRPGDLTFALTLGKILLEHRGRLDPVLDVDGFGRAALALVANTDPYSYAKGVALHVAPQARFEGGLDLVAPRRVRPHSLPRLLAYVALGRGQTTARDVVYAHDGDRFEIHCDRALPLQVDGEDLGDVEHAVFEAERDALTVLA